MSPHLRIPFTRSSRRGVILDPCKAPVYPTEELLTQNEIVELKFTLPPLAVIVRPGETLRVIVSGQSQILPRMPKTVLRNKGVQIIHAGAKRQSRLILPIVVG